MACMNDYEMLDFKCGYEPCQHEGTLRIYKYDMRRYDAKQCPICKVWNYTCGRPEMLITPYFENDCEYCNSTGLIETDNNGPIGNCPVCNADKATQEINEHLHKLAGFTLPAEVMMMEVSTCCDAERWLNLESDICSSCKEHAEFIEEDDDEVCSGTETEND